MMIVVSKGTRLNLRISEEFREQLEELARYHGLTLSSYSHSVLVKAVRKEWQELEAAGAIGSQREHSVNKKIAIPPEGIPISPTGSKIPFGKTNTERKRKAR